MAKTKMSWEILEQYLAGEANPLQSQLAEQWLAEHADVRLLLVELNRSGLDHEMIRHAAADIWARLQRGEAPTIGSRSRATPRAIPRDTGRTVFRRRLGALKAAAAVALVLGGSLVVWQRQRTRTVAAGHATATFGTIAAPVGRLPVSALLPDGSHVILSPGSMLRYAPTFLTRREVELDGEAYFEVRHNARHPFVVHAGALIAEDLGTEFVVRAYLEDPYGRVIVRKGRVGIESAVVGPGELGHLVSDGPPIVEPADTAVWFAWTRGQLNLDGMLLRDALPKLSRWYDRDFRLADPSLGNRALVGEFPTQLDDKVLEQVVTALGLRMTRQGRIVMFHAGPASHS